MKYLFIAALLSCSSLVSAQVVKVEPEKPTSDKEITLTFDLNLAADPRAKKLLGKTDDVFLWSGAGVTPDGNPFKFRPKDQVKWSKPNESGKMTYVGDNVWSIKLTPRTYFAVPDSLPIKRLGLVLRSGNGKAQTEDFSVEIFDN
jgi:hypothetical protein